MIAPWHGFSDMRSAIPQLPVFPFRGADYCKASQHNVFLVPGGMTLAN